MPPFVNLPRVSTSSARYLDINLGGGAGAASAPPTIASLGTPSASVFDDALTQTVNGANFDAASTVSVDGVAMATTYVSPSQLTAVFSAAVHYPNGAGTRAVTVANSAGTSAAFSYAVAYPVQVKGHWRADLGISISSGALVSVWADQSGNGLSLTQPTTGNQPTRITGAVNGKPALSFQGSAAYMATGNFTLAQPFRYLLVERIPTAGSVVAMVDGTVAGNRPILYKNSTTPTLSLLNMDSLTVVANNTAATLNAWNSVAALYSGASSSLTVNGTTTTGDVGTATKSQFLASGITLAKNATSGVYCAVDVAEFILVSGFTAAQLTNYTAYRVATFGL